MANVMIVKKCFRFDFVKIMYPAGLCLLFGAQTELIFDGASMCLDSKGELVKLGKFLQEDFFILILRKNTAD